MKRLIALDDGHGMETAGKRTPPLPGGLVMRENEFNRRVAQLLDGHLKRCGFDTLLVAPNDIDTPLQVRTDAANNAKADLFVSVHANAIGVGWNGTRGIETFHFAGSLTGEKAARIIHRNLLAGTRLPDRAVKIANFHVLRETHMPAVLVECAFMTNPDDAQLLLSEIYRAECAEELARGVCEYFNVPFVPTTPTATPSPTPDPSVVTIIVNGQQAADGKLEGGKALIWLRMAKAWVPLRDACDALGAEVIWEADTKTAKVTM